jgi:hypothetical protein
MTNSFLCTMQVWEHEDTMPIGLWVWSGAEQVTGNAERKYREYTDLIDVLTHMQVRWGL